MFMRQALFTNRNEAGRRLAERLLRFEDEGPVVLALPRAGVPIGFEVARALAAPLDLVHVRKIGAPFQPELAVGAVVDGGRAETVINESWSGNSKSLRATSRRRARVGVSSTWPGGRERRRGTHGNRGRRRHRHRRDDEGRSARYAPGQSEAPRASDARRAAGYARAPAPPSRRGGLPGRAEGYSARLALSMRISGS